MLEIWGVMERIVPIVIVLTESSCSWDGDPLLVPGRKVVRLVKKGVEAPHLDHRGLIVHDADPRLGNHVHLALFLQRLQEDGGVVVLEQELKRRTPQGHASHRFGDDGRSAHRGDTAECLRGVGPVDTKLELIAERHVEDAGMDLDLAGDGGAETLEVSIDPFQGGGAIRDLDNARGHVDSDAVASGRSEQVADLLFEFDPEIDRIIGR